MVIGYFISNKTRIKTHDYWIFYLKPNQN